MSRRKNPQYIHLQPWLADYCLSRTLDFSVYSPYHMRIMDGGYITLDIWTTGRYYVMQTDYNELFPGKHIVERGGEKGNVHATNQDKLYEWLDQLFFAEAFIEEN